MTWHPRSWTFGLALAVGLAVALPFFSSAGVDSRARLYSFEVTLDTGGGGFAQLYYDAGQPFSEQNSIRRDITPGPQVYQFPLPLGIYRSLRFDPINHAGAAVFRDARVVDARGRVVRRFPPELFLAAYQRNATHDIASLILTDGALDVRTVPAGDDPYLVIELERPLLLGPPFWTRAAHALAPFSIVFLAVLGFAGFVPREAATRWRIGNARTWMTAGGVTLVAVKLWLVVAQPVYAIGDAGHDDHLFLQQANQLLAGNWLGPYSQFTLMKGPMYPLFISAVFLLGIPLFVAQHLLYIGACWLMVKALRPLVPSRGLRAAIFTVLLFNPITFDGIRSMRVARQDLLPALVLLIVSALVGLYARCDQPKRRLVPWALLAGIALSAFWLTREEAVWILPCAGLLWAAAAVRVWFRREPDRLARLALLAAPVLFWWASLAAAAAVNWRCYGVFTTCEFRHREFRDAYGALSRVTPARWRPWIVMPRETRERIYAVSPAFAALRPYLEGPVGESWALVSQGVTHLPAEDREIGGGMFMWALRDAVVDAGRAPTGAKAMAYYAQLAREVNAACDQGLLPAGPHRSGFLPPLRREHLVPFIASARRALGFLFYFNDLGAGVPPSDGAPANLLDFTDLTRGRLSPRIGGAPLPPKQRWLDRVRLGVLDQIAVAYSWAAPWAIGSGVMALLAALAIGAIRRRVPYFALLGVALLASVGAMVAIASLIDATSFPAVDVTYLVGCYTPVLLAAFAGWLALAEALRRNRAGGATGTARRSGAKTGPSAATL